MPFRFIDIPEDCKCSITHNLMVDPVFTAAGETYERTAIADWLTKQDTDPHTQEKLEHTTLTSNHKLKNRIAEFVEKNQETFKKELIEAVNQKDLEIVALVLKSGIPVDTQDAQGWTALHHAVHKNDLAMVNLLLTYDCNVNQDTAFFEFKGDERLDASHTQQLEKLYQESTALNRSLLSWTVLQDLDSYDAVEKQHTLATVFVGKLVLEIDKINQEMKNLTTQIQKCEEARMECQKGREAANENRSVYRKESENCGELYRLRLDYHSQLNAAASEVYSRTDREYHANLAKDLYERINKLIAERYPQNSSSPGEEQKEQEKKLLVSQISALTDQRHALQLRINAIQENKIKLLKQCLENQYTLIATRLITLEMIACDAESMETLSFDIHTLRQIINKHCIGIDEKKTLDIKRQLHFIEEKILGIHRNSQYVLPYTVSRCTPLLLAVREENIDLIALLLSRKAKLDKVDNRQATILHWAARSDQTSLITLLLTHGADTHARDERGSTPLDIAHAFGHLDIIQLIECHMQEQQLSSTLEKHLQSLRDEIQTLKLQIQLPTNPHDTTSKLPRYGDPSFWTTTEGEQIAQAEPEPLLQAGSGLAPQFH